MEPKFNPNIEDYTEEESFIDKMLRRVKDDFSTAKAYLDGYHRDCNEKYAMYHSASYYESLRRVNRFPLPLMQEFTDQFVAHVRDKLFYANRPCTVVGVEETDKPDADAKQDMINWQDYKDHLHTKIGIFIRDCALYRRAVAQVDFVNYTRREWAVQEVEVDAPEQQSWLDQAMGRMPKKMERQWQQVDVPTYRGPQVKRIDPRDFFHVGDKETTGDAYPMMVRTYQPIDYFNSKPYFFNQAMIKEKPSTRSQQDVRSEKKGMLDQTGGSGRSLDSHEYIEWQGLVKKVELYELTGQDQIEGELVEIDPREYTWVICGVVDQEVVVRLEEGIPELDGPNIIVGYIETEEDDYLGIAPSDKIKAIHKGSEVLIGIALENLKQNVNAMWGINYNALHDKKPPVNKAGGIFLTSGNPNEAIKRFEQPLISRDIYTFLDMFRQLAMDAYGLQNITQGRGDPKAETLGEATMVEGNAALRMRDYLKTFEDTFLIPLYEMRNKINMAMLDVEYVYGIIGESAIEWRTIDPARIRASVDFMCESSTRETNKAVLVSQLLQLIELAPLAIQNGQPVRIDKMMKLIAETGFSLKREQFNEFFPLLKLEDQGLIDVDGLLINAALGNVMINSGMVPPPGGGNGKNAGAGRSPGPRPMTEGEATQSANQEGQPQVREA